MHVEECWLGQLVKSTEKNTLVLSCISLCFYTIRSLNDIVKITTLLLQEVRFTLALKICICSFSFLHVGTKKLIFPKKYEMAKISTYRIYLLIQVTVIVKKFVNTCVPLFGIKEIRVTWINHISPSCMTKPQFLTALIWKNTNRKRF